MSEFNHKKLHVFFDDKINSKKSKFPRKYTLTHSDITGDLFLSIGKEYDYKKISSLYSKLMRDEILGEWQYEGQIKLDIYCLVSGGIALGTARWRESIFRHHMKMALEAICYGDRSFLKEEKDFLIAHIYVNFLARRKKTKCTEQWGRICDFMPEN
jgi:hypothetical protein